MESALFALAVLVFLAAFAATAFGRVLRRAHGVAQQLRNPGQLGALLSEETRRALQLAGRDPDALQMDADLDPALRQLVTADLIRAFGLPLKPGVGGSVRIALGRSASPPPEAQAPQAPPPLATEPPPYQVGGDPGALLRGVLTAAILAVAAALYIALR